MRWLVTLGLACLLPGLGLFLVELVEAAPRLRRAAMGAGVVFSTSLAIAGAFERAWGEALLAALLAIFWQRAYVRARERIV